MGTKANPGKHDCYRKLAEDEPYFTLRGIDRDAPVLVELWAELRKREGEDPAVIAEAMQCAKDMRAYMVAKGRTPHDPKFTPRIMITDAENRGEKKGELTGTADAFKRSLSLIDALREAVRSEALIAATLAGKPTEEFQLENPLKPGKSGLFPEGYQMPAQPGTPSKTTTEAAKQAELDRLNRAGYIGETPVPKAAPQPGSTEAKDGK